ncbi:hypothetical protein BS78_05G251600 [Paspalum vaginatum]|nr:hypothetical protein BS78_05G251600 [Paspalum vaginatum]KAJ1276895.1 hypothetical protein BS78_05G251600 [Paspalum vaginatum]
MADPVATVEKIVKIGLAIKDAVDTVRHNEEECNEIRRRVLRFSAILSQLQQTGMMSDSPAMIGALEDLEETLQHALELVTACQETGTIRRLVMAGELSKKLRRVKDDILNKVMLASFAINAHTTIILLTIQAGGHTLPQQPEDSRVADVSHNILHSTEDARSELNDEENTILTGSDAPFHPVVDLRNFNLSELKAAIRGGYVIGQGGFWKVYKCVLNDGNVVAVKVQQQRRLPWQHCHDQLLLASKLQHRNIVKVLGYGHEVGHSSMIMRLLKRKNDQAQDREYIWVEEYVPNGSLDRIIHESRLDWPSLSRIIEGLAQGINYLHEQHIVHRDVKPSNVLLDYEMNPKIIDFDLCLALNDDGHEIIEDTTYLAGTLGYVPPEYVSHGIVSVENDVYSFGATLLETVSTLYVSSGFDSDLPSSIYNNTGACQATMKACSAWEDGRMEGLFDPLLFDGSHQLMEIKRYTQVGLLCLQDEPADRPTMADVLAMLHGEKEMRTPKIPAYIKVRKEEESDEEESDGERPASPCALSDVSLSPR